ncbi:hypothetical protein [Parashewanella tropica]|uniref:hypothetical protein n=1 Tax=Parashewanella tropica TaxID=2547970 RepID=UPI00105A67B1|nr:hypothetical protein [Parashewanella tropica]
MLAPEYQPKKLLICNAFTKGYEAYEVCQHLILNDCDWYDVKYIELIVILLEGSVSEDKFIRDLKKWVKIFSQYKKYENISHIFSCLNTSSIHVNFVKGNTLKVQEKDLYEVLNVHLFDFSIKAEKGSELLDVTDIKKEHIINSKMYPNNPRFSNPASAHLLMEEEPFFNKAIKSQEKPNKYIVFYDEYSIILSFSCDKSVNDNTSKSKRLHRKNKEFKSNLKLLMGRYSRYHDRISLFDFGNEIYKTSFCDFADAGCKKLHDYNLVEPVKSELDEIILMIGCLQLESNFFAGEYLKYERLPKKLNHTNQVRDFNQIPVLKESNTFDIKLKKGNKFDSELKKDDISIKFYCRAIKGVSEGASDLKPKYQFKIYEKSKKLFEGMLNLRSAMYLYTWLDNVGKPFFLKDNIELGKLKATNLYYLFTGEKLDAAKNEKSISDQLKGEIDNLCPKAVEILFGNTEKGGVLGGQSESKDKFMFKAYLKEINMPKTLIDCLEPISDKSSKAKVISNSSKPRRPYVLNIKKENIKIIR